MTVLVYYDNETNELLQVKNISFVPMYQGYSYLSFYLYFNLMFTINSRINETKM